LSELQLVSESLFRLISHIERNNYKGYDPYDALKSPIFRLPILKSHKPIRFGIQQLIKRFPLNLRPLLFIPKGYNPVTLGLCLQGYSFLYKNSDIWNQESRIKISHSPILQFTRSDLKKRIDYLIAELKSLISPGYHGTCWGYDFPWEARYASIPPYGPTVVATGIISNALFNSFQITGSLECAELVEHSARFVLNDLNKSNFNDLHIYSYSPFDNQQVFNASMKGARLLAQAYSLNKEIILKEEAEKAVKFVIKYQRKDGSWPYSLASSGKWTDNYHTGYVLDCLDDYIRLTGDDKYLNELQKGYNFYKEHFINADGVPAIYQDRIYPADCTSAAQSILTLTRFGDIDLSFKVALWTINNMQSPAGYFYYKKHKNWLVKTNFMRWSDAWLFGALAFLMDHEQRVHTNK